MRWERFFNWQSDMDWTWGPLLPLRPPRDTPIRPWVWTRLFLAFTLIGTLLLGLLVGLCILLPKIAAMQRTSLPSFISETIQTLTAMVRDPSTLAQLLGLLLSLPVLFFTFCLPYHWAWNRRAIRLKIRSIRSGEERESTAEVWPPAIRTHPVNKFATLPKREGEEK